MPTQTPLSAATGATGKVITADEIRLDDRNGVLELGACKLDLADLYRIKVNYDTVDGDEFGGMLILSTVHQAADVGEYSIAHRVTFNEASVSKVKSIIRRFSSQSGQIKKARKRVEVIEFELPHLQFATYLAGA